ncbi:IPT/TIG domain-containing protein [Streptomyces microflavus]|uniref:IPT/TIG domain-containing protein n=1 Tax=Streptomyces microflavus TaxID=1919 RepID=UPI0037FAC022
MAAGVLTVLAPPASAAGVCAAPVVDGATTTITCSAAGTGSIVVPENVSAGVVTLDGAGGGPAADGTLGGKGAHIVATIPVTPGQTYNVAVGAKGVFSGPSSTVGRPGIGGGLVAVTTDADAPLLTAGSGGGAGGPGIGTPKFPGAPGGDSGGVGAAGNGQTNAEGGDGGNPGTALAGGIGGVGGSGSLGTGNNGLNGAFPNGLGGSQSSAFSPTGFGGLGGAGYGGGGGGGVGGRSGSGLGAPGGGGGGGGGGSSLISGTVPGSPVTLVDGANAGNGLVVFVFTQDAPTITSVSPSSGLAAGGEAVTITGTNLVGADITFGLGNPATGVTCAATSCTVTAPAGSGTVDVRAATPGGTSAATAADQYTYIPVPAVTSLSPTSGTTSGGTVVTVTGTGLAGATAITFGPGNPATAVTCTATSCTATAPAHTAGTVDVQVTTPGGTSAVVSAGQYTYVDPKADIDVDVTAQPHLGILVPYLTYTLKARNTGPDAATSATLTATLPAGKTATNLSAGCTSAPGTVTCTYGAIANGASATSTFRLPIGILALGHVTVSATRTASAPTDPNPANDSDSATCTVVSIILATCP